MIKVYRTKNPNVSYFLYPWFIESDKDRVQIGYEVYQRMKDSPEDTFCAIAENEGIIQGFLFAYMNGDDCFIWQAKASMSIRREVMIVWQNLIKWAKEKKAKRIFMYPDGREKLFQKKFGFSPTNDGGMELCLTSNQNQAENQNSQAVA